MGGQEQDLPEVVLAPPHVSTTDITYPHASFLMPAVYSGSVMRVPVGLGMDSAAIKKVRLRRAVDNVLAFTAVREHRDTFAPPRSHADVNC